LPLSLDWEDWFQLCCPPYDQPDALDQFECRLPLATDLALSFCSETGARATWFCLADQAHRHPSLLRRIADEGHAIGLHGLTHQRAFTLNRTQWRQSLVEGKARIEDLSGRSVVGYRAPEWSLRGPAQDWWEDLPELGFVYDSSRVPLAVIGNKALPRRPYRLVNGLWELPPPVLWSGPWRCPLWGWGPRVLPFSLVRQAYLELASQDAGTPLVLHPWELDERQPSLPGGTFGHRFVHCAGLRGVGSSLRDLMAGIQLVSLETWLETARVSCP
jgi:polysaccharide deacetylase family protein (PEP-CTERM system associated)